MTAGEAEPGAALEKGEREVQEESILTAEFYTPTQKAGSDWKQVRSAYGLLTFWGWPPKKEAMRHNHETKLLPSL